MGRREHCAAEIRAKLQQRAYPDELIERVIARLVGDGYLSEARYAEAFLRMRLGKGETPWLAAQRARARGVDEMTLQQALSDCSNGFDAFDMCLKLLTQRDPGGLRFDDERVWQRQARFLRNKGFDTATILSALKSRDD